MLKERHAPFLAHLASPNESAGCSWRNPALKGKGNANLLYVRCLTIIMMSTMAMNGGIRITSGAEYAERGEKPGTLTLTS
jgi:hypothetical protein